MDVRQVFDDIYDAPAAPSAWDVLGMVSRQRLPAVSHRVEPACVNETAWSFAPSHSRAPDKDMEHYPLLRRLVQRFDRAVGRPKYVRVDDRDSYRDFRDERRQSHIDALPARLERGDDVVGAIAEAARGGRSVPLPVSRGHQRYIDCWLDGDEVIVSVQLPDSVVTTGAPLLPDLEDVVGCAEACGFLAEEAVIVGCRLAPSVAGMRALGDMGRVKSHLRGRGVYLARPNADARMAGLMALIQKAQHGDKTATREALSRVHDAPDEVEEARDRLVHAQRQKRRRT